MEAPRAQIVRSLQMELFQIEVALNEFAEKRKQIKAELVKHGAGTKVCSRCKEECDIDQFYRDKQKMDHRTSWCQECLREKQDRFREKERNKRAA